MRVNPSIKTSFGILLAIFLTGGAAFSAGPASSHIQLRLRAVATLRNALKNAVQWEKVHAGEALIWNGYPQGVRETFEAELKMADLDYRIAVWRVMAQLPSNDRPTRQRYINKIYRQSLHAKGESLIGILETLGKLRFSRQSQRIFWLSRHGDERVQVMARWVLANSGRARDEAILASSLQARDSHVRGYAAYALRFARYIRPSTLQKLQAAARQEPIASSARVYILSACYVHSSNEQLPSSKKTLLPLVNGTAAQKYEFCMALARRGASSDIAVVQKLLNDEIMDVRIGAANALLRIDGRETRFTPFKTYAN